MTNTKLEWEGLIMDGREGMAAKDGRTNAKDRDEGRLGHIIKVAVNMQSHWHINITGYL